MRIKSERIKRWALGTILNLSAVKLANPCFEPGSEATPRSARPEFVEEYGEHSSSVRQIGRGAAIERLARARTAIVAGCVRTTNDSMGRPTGDCKIFEIQLTVKRRHQECTCANRSMLTSFQALVV